MKDMEDGVAQSIGLEAVQVYTGAIMGEIVNPLEALNNLLYLLSLPARPEVTLRYVQLAQEQVLRLNEITQRTLIFCCDHSS